MKTIKQAIVILLAILVVANVVSYFYFGASTKGIPPKISCPADVLEITVEQSRVAEVLLKDVAASDQQDGDLTDRITIGGVSKLITKDTAKVTYLVFDNDNNVASCTRKIRYTDYQRPTFKVTEPLIYSTTEEVALLARLKATDVLDGDISESIRVSTLEPTKNSEIFNVTVQVSNSMADTSWVTLPVLIQESNPLRPEIMLSDSLIYLDQGEKFTPSAYILSLRVPGMETSIADITVDNTVDSGKPGTYYVSYSYSANGSTGTAILTVVVQ